MVEFWSGGEVDLVAVIISQGPRAGVELGRREERIGATGAAIGAQLQLDLFVVLLVDGGAVRFVGRS